jgi:hypothetical protein
VTAVRERVLPAAAAVLALLLVAGSLLTAGSIHSLRSEINSLQAELRDLRAAPAPTPDPETVRRLSHLEGRLNTMESTLHDLGKHLGSLAIKLDELADQTVAFGFPEEGERIVYARVLSTADGGRRLTIDRIYQDSPDLEFRTDATITLRTDVVLRRLMHQRLDGTRHALKHLTVPEAIRPGDTLMLLMRDRANASSVMIVERP